MDFPICRNLCRDPYSSFSQKEGTSKHWVCCCSGANLHQLFYNFKYLAESKLLDATCSEILIIAILQRSAAEPTRVCEHIWESTTAAHCENRRKVLLDISTCQTSYPGPQSWQPASPPACGRPSRPSWCASGSVYDPLWRARILITRQSQSFEPFRVHLSTVHSLPRTSSCLV